MFKHTLIISALASALILSSSYTFAADQQQVYGSQLMTQQERLEFHTRLRDAKSEGERQQIRNEHHKKMQKRAKAQGLTLPDKPSARGKGMGPGNGMGQRDGMGPGSGRGR
jgi:hypothetical protein